MKKNKLIWLIIIIVLSAFFAIIYYQTSQHANAKKLPLKVLHQPQLTISKQLIKKLPLVDFEVGLNMDKAFERKVATMTLEEKVGQLFLARVPETKELADLKRYHLGGYLLFSRDIDGETQATLKKKITHYQQAATIPLLMASDEEGGLVSRLSYEEGFLKEAFKSPQELYKDDGLASIKKDLGTKATILHDLGISLPLAPVADVSTDPSSFIYERTLGKTTTETATYISNVVTEMAALNIGSTLKHFPGYGDNRDSHLEIVHDKRSLVTLEKEALPPFISGIKAGADSILISHNIVEAIDPDLPASVSAGVYQLLRDDLDFKGVIMTDDFDMAGLKEFTSQEEAAVMAINSSADLILSSSYQTQIPAVIKAVADGHLSEEKINKSVIRVLTLKYNLDLIELD